MEYKSNCTHICHLPDYGYGFAKIGENRIDFVLPRHVSNTPKMKLVLKSYEIEYDCQAQCICGRISHHPIVGFQGIATKPLLTEITIRATELWVTVCVGSDPNLAGVFVDHIDLKNSFEQGKLVYFPPTDYDVLHIRDTI